MTTDPVDTVTSLLDTSLLRMVDAPNHTPRYLMLETVREFGLEQLAASGDEDAVRDRHADWCLTLVEESRPFDSPASQMSLLRRLDTEQGNLRATLHHLERSGRLPEVQDLIIRLRWFWNLGGHASEGLEWCERVIEHRASEPDEASIDVLMLAGQCAGLMGRSSAAAYNAEALRRARAAGDALREEEATFYEALMAENRGDYTEAAMLFQAAQRLSSESDIEWRFLGVTYHLGVLAYARGELDTAVDLLETAITGSIEIGEEVITALCQSFLALIACAQGDTARAVELVQHHVQHDSAVMLSSQIHLGAAAVVATTIGKHESTARLFGSAARSGALMSLPERTAFEHAEAVSREALGDEAYHRAWSIGLRMSRQDVMAEIERLASAPDAQTAPGQREESEITTVLSPRQLEVLRLLAEGLPNQEIADALFVSRPTVAHHVANILAKLGVDNRTAAVSYAVRHQLA